MSPAPARARATRPPGQETSAARAPRSRQGHAAAAAVSGPLGPALPPVHALTAQMLLQLQRSAGDRAVTQLLRGARDARERSQPVRASAGGTAAAGAPAASGLAAVQRCGEEGCECTAGSVPETALQRAPGDALDTPGRRSRSPRTVLQRGEQGSGLADPLYLADRKWSGGQGPDDRVTGRRLQNWAIARGSFVVRDEATLVRMQEQVGVEATIVEEIYALLVDLLHGVDPRRPEDTGHILVGTSPPRAPYPAGGTTSLDKFDGSANARGLAVLELADHWGPIEGYLTRALAHRYNDLVLEAYGRAPKDMRLVTDTDELKRVRYQKYRHEHLFAGGFGAMNIAQVGQRYGRWVIEDIYKTLGSRSTGPGTLWVSVFGYPLWYYRGGVDALDQNAFAGEVARGVAESAKFAGMLFPLMVKYGGFAMSFSPNPVMIIAGAVFEEFGEEGIRDLSGEGRSFKDVAGSVGIQILINLVMNKVMGGGEHPAAGSEAGRALAEVAEKSAAKVRAAVKEEIAHSEGPQLAHAIEAGQARHVEDEALRREGFTQEVEIKHDGGSHVYRRKPDGTWCRWSTRPVCELDMGAAANAAAPKQLPAGKEVQITSDIERASAKRAERGKGQEVTVYQRKKLHPRDASEEAEVRMAEQFAKEGHTVHFNADDRFGDLTVDGVRADVKYLNRQKRSITSAVREGAGQAPNLIIDGTVVKLTSEDTARLLRKLEDDIARHPERFKDIGNIETIYIVEGDGTIHAYHRGGGAAPLKAPDPERPTIRSAGE